MPEELIFWPLFVLAVALGAMLYSVASRLLARLTFVLVSALGIMFLKLYYRRKSENVRRNI